MASKKQLIVIKKIYINKGGHHGGSWKVALADFMTAMMAFFLVMWLLGQNEETKKAISDYFSTPSMIEYNYENYGAELTLEKLFLDFVNEPLKAVKSFFEPSDSTPNMMDLGSPKVMAAFMADKLTDIAKNVNISKDGIEFDIPDNILFAQGTSQPKPEFVSMMQKLTAVTTGLKESEVKVTSALFIQAVPDQQEPSAEKVAAGRLDLIKNKIAATFEHQSNKVIGSTQLKDKKGEFNQEKLIGFIHISIKPKLNLTIDKDKKTASDQSSATEALNKPVFENLVNEALGNEKKKDKKRGTANSESGLLNPVEAEVNKLNNEAEPISE